MRILFCGTILPERYEMELQYLSSAANRFQWNMIRTLREQEHTVTVLSYVGFPIEAEKVDQLKDDCRIAQIQVVLRNKGLPQALLAFQRKLKEKMGQVDSVWVYNVLYPWLSLGKMCGRLGKIGVLILADYSPSVSYRDLFHKLYAGLQERSIRQFDLVVGLSGNVKRILKPSQRFLLMEGGIDIQQYEDFPMARYQKGQKLVLMYSGLLSHVTGVDLLLEAFSGIKDPMLELVITGKGNLESMVKGYERSDSRLHYYGQLSYGEYLKRLREAHILVNPRNMYLPENQNNFPSKIMEYLASGRKIISTRFVGYERFEDIVRFCESDMLQIRETMQEEAEMFREDPDLYKRQKALAQQFDWRRQVERVVKASADREQVHKRTVDGQSFCVVIPVYKEVPDKIDKIVISNILSQMVGYDVYFVVPKGFDIEKYKTYGAEFKFFEKRYFRSEKTYSRLLLKTEFYEAFQEYEYMLIVQTDAWIFKKGADLAEFTFKGYDYIGAPWREGIEAYPVAFKGLSYIRKFMKKRTCYVGNGGLSLRNIQKTCMLLREKRRYTFLWNTGEDVFFAFHGQESRCNFHIAPVELAGQLALEKNAKEQIGEGQLPFGVHGWDKYYPELIQDREKT